MTNYYGSAIGLAHLMGRRKRRAAAPSAPSPSRTSKPPPKAKVRPPRDREASPAEWADAFRLALDAERDARAFQADSHDTFAARVEAARAMAEGREPRADLVEGPEQTGRRPMDANKFAARVRRARDIADGK